MSKTIFFCDIIKQRSEENLKAVSLLYNAKLYGHVVGILRQELDSLIRVIYLLSLDLNVRQHFITQTLENKPWKTRGVGKVYEGEMVALADKLNGWTESVYKVGCSFIHLSSLHHYVINDPFASVPQHYVENILSHLNKYHHANISSLTVENVAPYLQKVFDKIYQWLKKYLQELEDEVIHSELLR